MKTSRTVLLSCLFIAFSAAVIFANGSKESAKSGKIIVKALAYGDNSNAEGQAWKRIVSAFEAANPDIDIDDEMLYDEAYHQKVTARLASGDIPDLAYMGADARWGKPWQEAGQQIDMRSYLDQNKYDMKLIPNMGPKGEIYYLPLGTSNMCTVVFENRDLLLKLGLNEPKTYDDWVKMVPVARAKGVEVVSTHGADGWAWGSCLMSCFIARTSGDPNWIQKAAKGEKKFTDPEFVAALSVLATMVKDGVLSSKTVQIDSGAGISDYSNGKCLFYVTGQWDAGNFTPDAQKGTRLMAFPKLPGEKGCTGTVAAAWQVGYGLTKKGISDEKVRKAAIKFLDFFNSTEEVTERLRDGLIVAPVLKNYKVPADMPPIISEKVALGTTAPNTDVIDSYLSGKANDTLLAGCQQIVAGTKTPAQVAAEIQLLVK
jgi:raffinose/stachyose/melibiose transport system substrate-binding protein